MPDSLTPAAKSSNDIEHEASSIPQSQGPTTTSEHEAPLSLSLVTKSLPSGSTTKDMLLQSLMADPDTRTRIVAMLREDLTVVRSSFYDTLGANPSWAQTQTELETPAPLQSKSASQQQLCTVPVISQQQCEGKLTAVTI